MGEVAESVADGVWRLQGSLAKTSVYLIRDDHGVTLFDAGVRSMAKRIGEAAAALGGISRVVLGHSHSDHRGAAPLLDAPVYCHPDERAHAEADDPQPYFDFGKLDVPARFVMPRLLARWDGGPVSIAETLDDGDAIAGFRVVHVPGHSPGQIALWRERDRIVLTSDVFYTFDPQTGLQEGSLRRPHAAFNLDENQTGASIRRIAALDPAVAWPGHSRPVTGPVRAQLEAIA